MRGHHAVGAVQTHDEAVAEDPPADTWLNSNFPYGWKEHDAHAGLFATDEPGARALCDFVLEHRDIAAVVTLGGYDAVTSSGPQHGTWIRVWKRDVTRRWRIVFETTKAEK